MSDVSYIALGSNLGDRGATLERAAKAIAEIKGVRVLGETSVEDTVSIGPIKQGNYLNQMLAVSSDLSPRALLASLQRIERSAGRVRCPRPP